MFKLAAFQVDSSLSALVCTFRSEHLASNALSLQLTAYIQNQRYVHICMCHSQL